MVVVVVLVVGQTQCNTKESVVKIKIARKKTWTFLADLEMFSWPRSLIILRAE